MCYNQKPENYQWFFKFIGPEELFKGATLKNKHQNIRFLCVMLGFYEHNPFSPSTLNAGLRYYRL